MSTTPKKEVVRGKRYTPEEKKEVVSFVTEYNAEHGRGGQSTAATKFGISQLTIASWLKNAGLSGLTGGSRGGIQNKLSTMLVLGEEIEKLEHELKAKRTKFNALKASL